MREALHINQHPGIKPPSFECKIINSKIIDNQYWIELDQTFYYPSGGGQPADHGTLNGEHGDYTIRDVKKRSEIQHLLGTDEIEIDKLLDQAFTASIDHERRDKLCRMHTAQHLISAAADELQSTTDKWFESLPGGPTLAKMMGLDSIGDNIQNSKTESKTENEEKGLSTNFKSIKVQRLHKPFKNKFKLASANPSERPTRSWVIGSSKLH